jgi:Fe-S cluster biosynthesis and repair protein YggX
MTAPTRQPTETPLFFRRMRVLQCRRSFPIAHPEEQPMAVQCVKCGKDGEPITAPLFMGRLETEIKAKVCQPCWKEWEGMRVMVINEYQINLGDENGRELVKKHMRAFLKLGEAVDTSKVQENYKPQ